MTETGARNCHDCGRALGGSEAPAGRDRLVSAGAGLGVALTLAAVIWGLTRSAEMTLVYPVVFGIATTSLVANDRALARLRRPARCEACAAERAALGESKP